MEIVKRSIVGSVGSVCPGTSLHHRSVGKGEREVNKNVSQEFSATESQILVAVWFSFEITSSGSICNRSGSLAELQQGKKQENIEDGSQNDPHLEGWVYFGQPVPLLCVQFRCSNRNPDSPRMPKLQSKMI